MDLRLVPAAIDARTGGFETRPYKSKGHTSRLSRPFPEFTPPPMIQITRETHEAPAAVQERIARTGGTNRYGEANFRVVWGGSRLTWIGGRWRDREPGSSDGGGDAGGALLREKVEMRRAPKYTPENRWHIERWTPPESYGSPESWYATTVEVDDGVRLPALGPYPSRGEYEHCFTLESARGEFIPLSPAACDWIVRAIEWSRRQPKSARREAITAREARREREFDRAADEILDGMCCG